MKSIMKTMDKKQDLDYDETFNSAKNLKICRRLVPELRKSMAPNYKPSTDQLTKWLRCLHKSRRSQRKIKNAGKSDKDQRRVHMNNRVNDVSIICYTEFYVNL